MTPFGNSIQLSKIEKGHGGNMGNSTTGEGIHSGKKQIQLPTPLL